MIVDSSKIVYVANSIAINNDFFLLIFMNTVFYLPAILKFIITTYFQSIDILQPTLLYLPLLLKFLVYNKLLKDYFNTLQIHLPMIIKFKVEFGYKDLSNIFIILKNLALTLINTKIINRKLANNLISNWI